MIENGTTKSAKHPHYKPQTPNSAKNPAIMSAIKPLKLYGGIFPANPFKVALVLEELGLPYETEQVSVAERKQAPFTKINPNGRTPALYDPNTDLKIWESGAIVSYLVDKYDKDHKIGFPRDSNEYYLANQWLHFQMSGQGPYFGQYFWFLSYHPEKVPSAVDRYYNEINRVTTVLEKWLAGSEDGGDGKGPRSYIMGEKCTYVDLVLLPWQIFPTKVVWKGKLDPETEFPNMMAWMKRIEARPSLARLLKEFYAEADPLIKAAEENMAKAREEENQ
ncbi:Transcriptional regulator ure2 [Microsporum audouinii]